MSDEESPIREVTAAYLREGRVVLAIGWLRKDVPVLMAASPWLLVLTQHAHRPDQHGMPAPEEQPAMADAIQPAIDLLMDRGATIVARISTRGIRNFSFYVPTEAAAQDAALALRQQSAYRIEVECRHDPQWRFYWEELAPLEPFAGEIERTKVVLQQLKEQGDELTEARDYNHIAVFPTPEARQAYAVWAASLGFRCAPQELPAEGVSAYGLWLTRSEVPDWTFLHGTLYEMIRKASHLGGVFSSDGCFVVVKKAE
jgi:hypothetical protein